LGQNGKDLRKSLVKVKHEKFYKHICTENNMKQTKILGIGIVLLVCLSLIVVQAEITGNAVSVSPAYVTMYAGEEASISIEVENNENFDIEDVSISLILDNVPFSSVGSSEKDIDDIDEDDEESISFTVRASTEITPGDYNIPYAVNYKQEDVDTPLTKSGSFGLRVSAQTDIEYSVETKDAIVGKKGRVSLKIVNKGLGEVKFVSAEIFASDNEFELLSEKYVYLGNIESDDSDLANYDVLFKSSNPTLTVKVDYKDFDNADQSKTVNLPVKVYTKSEALELGLITESKTSLYAGIIIVILLLWFIWRKYSKHRKAKKRRESR